jgi:glycosyltransferase involved in cell wall biosynthesis
MLLSSRSVFNKADAIFCVGRKESELMREKYPSRRVLYVPNGVDTEFFAKGDGAAFRAKHGIGSDERIILNVGRIMKQKNQALLVETLPAVLRQCPAARLVVVGAVIDPAYHDDMLKRAAALGVKERLTVVPGLPPNAPELADAYAACDGVVLPSTYETFGIVVLEAWASNKPVIASNVGGLKGFVEHEKSALLFEPDDGECLVNFIVRLLGDPQLCARLAESGREKANREYTWARRCDDVEAAYTQLIEAARK